MENNELLEIDEEISNRGNAIQRKILAYRSVFQVVTGGVLPLLILLTENVVQWSNYPLKQVEFYILIVLGGFQIYVVRTMFNAAPAIDEFSGLLHLRQIAQRIANHAQARKNAMASFASVLASMRGILQPTDPQDPLSSPIISKSTAIEKFAKMALEPLGTLKTEENLIVLGHGRKPTLFSASLYVNTGKNDDYKMAQRVSMDDFSAERIRHGKMTSQWEASRVWSFSDKFIELVSSQKKPYIISDLQDHQPLLAQTKQRSYDKDLYRGAMFLRSNWALVNGTLSWDFEHQKTPAYLIILSSGLVDGFPNAESANRELLVESIRDLLDICFAHAFQFEQTNNG